MKKLALVFALVAVGLSSCKKEDIPTPFKDPIVNGCECGVVTGHDVRSSNGVMSYYLDYRRDCDNVIQEVSTDRNTWYAYHSGDKICWE